MQVPSNVRLHCHKEYPFLVTICIQNHDSFLTKRKDRHFPTTLIHSCSIVSSRKCAILSSPKLVCDFVFAVLLLLLSLLEILLLLFGCLTDYMEALLHFLDVQCTWRYGNPHKWVGEEHQWPKNRDGHGGFSISYGLIQAKCWWREARGRFCIELVNVRSLHRVSASLCPPLWFRNEDGC